ncbi:MAG: FAD-dependent oxidoreductase [Clostridia bacterium]|nr:FAD-dependent oxidoreductase [Clostridia bacterium]
MKIPEPKLMPAYDVIVVGGGVAGISAAVAASRKGAKTLLMEKSVILGGLATLGLISWYEPICDGTGKQMISGISEELIRLSVRESFDDLPVERGGKEEFARPNDIRYATHYSPTIFALLLTEYLEENGVTLRLDTLATYPDVENGICKGILVETVGGREYFPAKFVIDATGDASVCHRAGVPTELGENYLTYVAHTLNREGAALAAEGDFCKARKWIMAGASLTGKGHPEGKGMLTCQTADDVTDFVVSGGKLMLERIRQSGKEDRDLMTLPGMPNYRKIRRIVGEYVFDGTEEEIKFDNAVGSMGDFRKRGKHYQLPYTTLYNKNFPNLFAAGRIISATGEGWEITRVIPVAALSGQGAGTAAALCLKTNTDANTLDTTLLRKTLEEDGVLFI